MPHSCLQPQQVSTGGRVDPRMPPSQRINDRRGLASNQREDTPQTAASPPPTLRLVNIAFTAPPIRARERGTHGCMSLLAPGPRVAAVASIAHAAGVAVYQWVCVGGFCSESDDAIRCGEGLHQQIFGWEEFYYLGYDELNYCKFRPGKLL